MSQVSNITHEREIPKNTHHVRWHRPSHSQHHLNDLEAFAFLRWFRENSIDRVWIMRGSEYEDDAPTVPSACSSAPASAVTGSATAIISKIRAGSGFTGSYRTVYDIWFENPDEAMLFKLTHGIK